MSFFKLQRPVVTEIDLVKAEFGQSYEVGFTLTMPKRKFRTTAFGVLLF